MSQFSDRHDFDNNTPPRLLPVLSKVKSTYLIWINFYRILPKIHRYSLGTKIDNIFIDTIEAISIATFLSKEEKQPWIRLAIKKIDTLKILLMVLWETKSLDDKKYIAISLRIEEIGKILGGWKKGLENKTPQIKPGRT